MLSLLGTVIFLSWSNKPSHWGTHFITIYAQSSIYYYNFKIIFLLFIVTNLNEIPSKYSYGKNIQLWAKQCFHNLNTITMILSNEKYNCRENPLEWFQTHISDANWIIRPLISHWLFLEACCWMWEFLYGNWVSENWLCENWKKLTLGK